MKTNEDDEEKKFNKECMDLAKQADDEISVLKERIKNLERELDYEKNRIKRVLTTDGKGSDYKAELLAGLLAEIHPKEERELSAKDCLEWLSVTNNVSMGQSMDGTYNVWEEWSPQISEIIASGSTPMEAIRSAMNMKDKI